MSKIFGGSKSKQQSTATNKAWEPVSGELSPLLSQATTGANSLAALLGGDTSGLNTFKNTTGFNTDLINGQNAITGNAAASGLLRSGSTAKGLVNYGTELNNKYANNYMDRLKDQAGLGFQAANALTDAGTNQQSTQKSSSKKGIGGFLGKAAGAVAASDIRLKRDIVKLETRDDGLNLYQFRYKDSPIYHVGLMAQEVEKVKPEAIVIMDNGYMAVDYSKMEGFNG